VEFVWLPETDTDPKPRMENFSRVTFSVVLTKTIISDMRPGLEIPRLRVWIFERSVKPRGPAGSRSNPAGRARLSIGRFRSSRLGWLPETMASNDLFAAGRASTGPLRRRQTPTVRRNAHSLAPFAIK